MTIEPMDGESVRKRGNRTSLSPPGIGVRKISRAGWENRVVSGCAAVAKSLVPANPPTLAGSHPAPPQPSPIHILDIGSRAMRHEQTAAGDDELLDAGDLLGSQPRNVAEHEDSWRRIRTADVASQHLDAKLPDRHDAGQEARLRIARRRQGIAQELSPEPRGVRSFITIDDQNRDGRHNIDGQIDSVADTALLGLQSQAH